MKYVLSRRPLVLWPSSSPRPRTEAQQDSNRAAPAAKRAPPAGSASAGGSGGNRLAAVYGPTKSQRAAHSAKPKLPEKLQAKLDKKNPS